MALAYKATKFINKGSSPTSTDEYLMQVEFHNFTIPNPPTQSLTYTVDKDQAGDAGTHMDLIDNALALLGSNEMDWTK